MARHLRTEHLWLICKCVGGLYDVEAALRSNVELPIWLHVISWSPYVVVFMTPLAFPTTLIAHACTVLPTPTLIIDTVIIRLHNTLF